jgi:hypothetical protein
MVGQAEFSPYRQPDRKHDPNYEAYNKRLHDT